MPTFTYTGITAAGQQIDGVVEAFDEIEAMERAREQCRVVQSVVPVREGKNLLSMDITKPKAKQKNLAVMCAQFATILNAGVPAARATSLVADQVTDKYLKRVLADVAAEDVYKRQGNVWAIDLNALSQLVTRENDGKPTTGGSQEAALKQVFDACVAGDALTVSVETKDTSRSCVPGTAAALSPIHI